MKVREGMTGSILSVGPGHTIREAARLMAERHVGAAVVMDPEGQGPAIITERDILDVIGRGQDPDSEKVGAHLTSSLVVAHPDWSLEEAATAMVRGNFRHLIVVDGGEICGVLAMRDIVRCWSGDGATSDMPEGAAA